MSSAILVLLIAALWISSRFRIASMLWARNGIRTEINSGEGTIVVKRLYEWPIGEKVMIAIEPLGGLAVPEDLKTTPWCQGDNSWWECIGWKVNWRTECIGHLFIGRFTLSRFGFIKFRILLWQR